MQEGGNEALFFYPYRICGNAMHIASAQWQRDWLNKIANSIIIILQAYLALFCFTDVAFLQTEGKVFNQQDDYNLLYFNTHFIVVVCNHYISLRCVSIKLLVLNYYIHHNI